MEFPEAEIVNDNEPVARPTTKKRRGGFLNFIKSLLIFFVLVGVVIGSFMISFQLGKQILIPVKNEPAKDAPVAVAKPEVSKAAMAKLEAVMAEEMAKVKNGTSKLPSTTNQLRINDPIVAKVAAKKTTKEVVTPKKDIKVIQAKNQLKKYFKVQAALFESKDKAVSLARQLMSDGFQTFIRQVDSGWRVQAGAYIKKTQAEAMQSRLKTRGYESILVYE